MSFALALAIAASWWGSHGVTIPCHPQPLYVSQSQLDAWGISEDYSASLPFKTTGRCDIVISPSMRIERKTAPWQYCGAVVHELWVLDGFPETTGPNTSVTDTFFATIYDCWHARHWRKLHWGY